MNYTDLFQASKKKRSIDKMALVKDIDITLNNGVKMPLFGLGTSRVEEAEITNHVLKWAFASGYRHIDTADMYRNHHFIKEALAKLAKPRTTYFLTTKIFLPNPETITHNEVITHIDRFLKELGVAYLDLLLLHWPQAASVVGYKALETCLAQKKTRSIGVCNFSIAQLKSLMSHTKIVPAVNQIQLSPGLRRARLVEFCHQNHIQVMSWRTLGGDYNILQNPTIVSIAHKYHVSEAQVCLRWATQQNIAVIPKSVNEARIKTNSELDSFMLTESDMTAINAVEEHEILWPFPAIYRASSTWDN